MNKKQPKTPKTALVSLCGWIHMMPYIKGAQSLALDGKPIVDIFCPFSTQNVELHIEEELPGRKEGKRTIFATFKGIFRSGIEEGKEYMFVDTYDIHKILRTYSQSPVKVYITLYG